MLTDNRRAFKRLGLTFTVKYKSLDKVKSHSGISSTQNISIGGVYFVSLESFKIGELLDCLIDMPEIKKQGHWKARVVRCENIRQGLIETFGVAAEFTEHSNDAEKNLKKYF